jgi:hypothetical protein
MTTQWSVSYPKEQNGAGAFGVPGPADAEKPPGQPGSGAWAQLLTLCSEMDQGEWAAPMVAMMDEDCRLLMQDLGFGGRAPEEGKGPR